MKAKVETFCLNDLVDKDEYEKLLNLELKEKIEVKDQNFSYDKQGRARVTIWWIEELEEDL